MEKNRFTHRQDVLRLTGLSSGMLSRLDNAGVIEPVKIGSSRHPSVVVYTRSQLAELMLVKHLRHYLTMARVKMVLEYLRSHDIDPSGLEQQYLIICNDTPAWATAENYTKLLTQLIESNKGVALEVVCPKEV